VPHSFCAAKGWARLLFPDLGSHPPRMVRSRRRYRWFTFGEKGPVALETWTELKQAFKAGAG